MVVLMWLFPLFFMFFFLTLVQRKTRLHLPNYFVSFIILTWKTSQNVVQLSIFLCLFYSVANTLKFGRVQKVCAWAAALYLSLEHLFNGTFKVKRLSEFTAFGFGFHLMLTIKAPFFHVTICFCWRINTCKHHQELKTLKTRIEWEKKDLWNWCLDSFWRTQQRLWCWKDFWVGDWTGS